VRKWLLLLAVVIGCGTALVVWFAVEGARQAADLDARWRQAVDRRDRARAQLGRACRHDGRTPLKPWRLATDDPDDGAPAEEIRQAQLDLGQALEELNSLQIEWYRRQQRWPARLRAEVRRRAGW
jgi:hypothetical protein